VEVQQVEDHKDQILLLVQLLLLLEVAQVGLGTPAVVEVLVAVAVETIQQDQQQVRVEVQTLQDKETMEELAGTHLFLLMYKAVEVVAVLEQLDKMPLLKLVEMAA
jgi:hypothetical protein